MEIKNGRRRPYRHRSVGQFDVRLGNKYLPLGIGAVVVLQLLYAYAPPLQSLFNTTALPLRAWQRLFLGGFSFFLLVEAEKMFIRTLRRASRAPLRVESTAFPFEVRRWELFRNRLRAQPAPARAP
jgi:magnesium-transporting ATPase (P-type)